MRADRKRFLYAATAISCDIETYSGVCRVLRTMARKVAEPMFTDRDAVPAAISQLPIARL